VCSPLLKTVDAESKQWIAEATFNAAAVSNGAERMTAQTSQGTKARAILANP